jgi:hypothetical protein
MRLTPPDAMRCCGCRAYPFTSLFTDLAAAEEAADPPCSGQQQVPPAARRPASIVRIVRAFQSVTGWRRPGRRSVGGVTQQQASSSNDMEEGGLQQPLLEGSSPV